MRWLLLLVSMLAFAFAFKATTAGPLALALLVGFGSLVASFLGFVSARIDAQAQSQMTKAATLVATSRGKLPAGTRTRQGAASAPLAGDSTSWTPGDAGHPHGNHGHHGHHEAGGSDWGADAGGDSGGGGGDGGGGGGD
mgnify:FL=1